MKTLILFLAMTTAAIAGPPCDDAYRDFKRAEKFGAYMFTCEDFQDGSATSTWKMRDADFKRFREAERQRWAEYRKIRIDYENRRKQNDTNRKAR